MKINATLFLLFAATFTISACKKEHHEDDDYSNYLLSKIQYGKGKSTTPTQTMFEYDSLNRPIRRTYETIGFSGSTYIAFSYQKNTITREYYYNHYQVYKTDNNGRIVSDIRYPEMDSTYYEYDSEGYLVNKRLYRYIYGFQIWQDSKYTYQNGNLVMEINAFYDAPGTQFKGADTLTYLYDNTAWYPEAIYLSHVPDVLTGKPNRNNITDIHVNASIISHNLPYYYDDVHYTYAEKGNRLGRVTMDFTDNRGVTRDTIGIDFNYKPKN
jgi:hypothetical protein